MPKNDATQTWTALYKLVSNIIVGAARPIEALGLEVKELFVLADIDEHPHPAELADALCIPKPSMTVYLKHLEKLGLVKREIDSADLRRHRLSITPAGRKVLAKGLPMMAEAFGERHDKLTPAQQAELAKLIALMT